MTSIRLLFARCWDRLFPRSCWPRTFAWAFSPRAGEFRFGEHCEIHPTEHRCWCGKKCDYRRRTRDVCRAMLQEEGRTKSS